MEASGLDVDFLLTPPPPPLSDCVQFQNRTCGHVVSPADQNHECSDCDESTSSAKS